LSKNKGMSKRAGEGPRKKRVSSGFCKTKRKTGQVLDRPKGKKKRIKKKKDDIEQIKFS